jgi:hypothetical protein
VPPPGTTLWEAGEGGYIGVMQVVEAIRAVPDPLAESKPAANMAPPGAPEVSPRASSPCPYRHQAKVS